MNQGTVIERGGKRYIRDYFIYTAAVEALASGDSSSDAISIEADSSFIVEKMAFMADIAGAAQTDDSRVIPLVRASIRDTGSGRNLQDEPVDISAMAGNGQLPAILPVPRIFQPRSSIIVTFENYSAATTYANVSLYLIGYKEWLL